MDMRSWYKEQSVSVDITRIRRKSDRDRQVRLRLTACFFFCFALSSSLAIQDAKEGGSHPQHVGSSSHPQPQVESSLHNSAISADSRVLGIRYRCANENVENSASASCVITVTKGEFDALVQAIDPQMTKDEIGRASCR